MTHSTFTRTVRRRSPLWLVALVAAAAAAAVSIQAQGALSIDPDTIEFPPTPVGAYSYVTATITNAGPEDDTIVAVFPQGESLFPTQAGTCNLQSWLIPSGTSCTYQFGFHPERPGRVRNTLTLTFASGATVEVSLTGRGRPH
jgi:hypothetical protein